MSTLDKARDAQLRNIEAKTGKMLAGIYADERAPLRPIGWVRQAYNVAG